MPLALAVAVYYTLISHHWQLPLPVALAGPLAVALSAAAATATVPATGTGSGTDEWQSLARRPAAALPVHWHYWQCQWQCQALPVSHVSEWQWQSRCLESRPGDGLA